MADTWDAFPTEAPRVPTPVGENGQPILRMTVTPNTSADTWDAFPETKPTDYAGLAKAGGIGVAKGGIGLAGMAGDLQALAGKAADWITYRGQPVRDLLPNLPEPSEQTKRYGEKYGGRGDVGPNFPLPTSHDIQGVVEKATGPFRQPQNQAERDAETVGEFLPAALAGPGGLARKVILQDAVPAAASIVAGRYSGQNPYVKALAGFLGGAAGAIASGPSSVQEILRSKIPASVTEQHITRAGQLIEHAQQRGVALTWPEALSRVTGQPVLTDMQRILESHGQTRGQMSEFFANRPAQVENAARAELAQTGGAHPNPSMLGSEVGDVAEGVLGRVNAAINRATRPSYDAARQSLVPTQVHAAMRDDPLFVQALDAVRDDPARNSFIRGLSDRSTIVYDAVKQELRERSQAALAPTNPNASRTVSAATGTLSGDVRDIAVAADRNSIGPLRIEKTTDSFGRRVNLIDEAGKVHYSASIDNMSIPGVHGISFVKNESREFSGLGPDFYKKLANDADSNGNKLVIGLDASPSARSVHARLASEGILHPVRPESITGDPAALRTLKSPYHDGSPRILYEVSATPGNLEHALAEQARLRQQYLEPLQRGPLGKIADKDQTTQKAMDALFPSNPLPNSAGEIRTAITALVGQRPAVAEQLVRAHAEMTFNEAMRELQGGASQFAGAKFAKVIAGNPQQRANLRAAVESLPNGAARWEGFEHLLDIMQATGTRQAKGSLTAFNELEIQSMTSGGMQALAAKAASPGKWMSLANDTFKAWSLGRNLDQLAHIITDPGAGHAFNQIVRIPAGSDRALAVTGRLIGQLGAATTEQRNQPRQANGR